MITIQMATTIATTSLWCTRMKVPSNCCTSTLWGTQTSMGICIPIYPQELTIWASLGRPGIHPIIVNVQCTPLRVLCLIFLPLLLEKHNPCTLNHSRPATTTFHNHIGPAQFPLNHLSWLIQASQDLLEVRRGHHNCLWQVHLNLLGTTR